MHHIQWENEEEEKEEEHTMQFNLKKSKCNSVEKNQNIQTNLYLARTE